LGASAATSEAFAASLGVLAVASGASVVASVQMPFALELASAVAASSAEAFAVASAAAFAVASASSAVASEVTPSASAAGTTALAIEELPFVVAFVASVASFVAMVEFVASVAPPAEPAFFEDTASDSVAATAPPAFAVAILKPAAVGSSVHSVAPQASAVQLRCLGAEMLLALLGFAGNSLALT